MELSGDVKKRVVSCMKTLPQELIIEILSWLSIKHLSPLRFVSKSWFRLLTKNPQFAKLQFDRFKKSNPNPSIIALDVNASNLFLALKHGALTLQFPFYQDTNKYHLSGISNGLLCFNRGDNKEVYIWNPLINNHITISCLPAPSTRLRWHLANTGFGFGFDQHSNVYKVVRTFTEIDFAAVSRKRETWTQISVYTIGVDSMWRTIQVDLPGLVPCSSRIPPLVNGFLHWESRARHVIYTFDLKREVIGELSSPCGIMFSAIVELGGLLCCVVNPSDVSEIRIWVMKEYGVVSSWSKQYTIAKPQGCIYRLLPLGFTDNGKIIMDKNSRHLALYSPETNTIRKLNRFREEVFHQYAYIGSIISPKVTSRADHNLLEEEI